MNKLTLNGGVANWAGIDTSLVRLAFVVAAVLGVGAPILIYLILGFVLD